MKTILGLLGVVAIAVIAVLAFQWWAGNNANQLTIAYPTDGTSLAGNTVPVRLTANQELKNKLNAAGDQTEIVTYLDDKEVGRGHDLEYSLTAIAPGQHRLSIAITGKENGQSAVSLSLMPKPVSFTLGGGSGANTNASLPPGVSSGVYADEATQPTPTPVVSNVPVATPVPQPTAAPALPATGEGGMAARVQVQAPLAQAVVPAAQPQVAIARPGQAPAVAVSGSQSQLVLADTSPNTNAVIAADQAARNANHEDLMSVAFRWIGAFYIAAFLVALAVILVVQRRRS